MSFYQIPGNVKQVFLPFVLNPSSALNIAADTSDKLHNNKMLSPQYFTYKTNDYAGKSGKGLLNFFPSSIRDLHIADDISFKLLYGRDAESKKTKASITLADVVNSIPGVQIREFLPDTRLDQLLNVITTLVEGFMEVFSSDNSEDVSRQSKEQSTKQSERTLVTKLNDVMNFTLDYWTGGYPNETPSFLKDCGEIGGGPMPMIGPELQQNSMCDYVLKLPYALYYTLQSCTSTSIYEIPAITSDKTVLRSPGGMAGWTDGGSDFMTSGGFRISNLLGKIPGVGSMLNMVIGNIGINYMPWWDAQKGADGQKEPTINIKFDLFNDRADAAMSNFIFVNTIVPNNKWIQYNFFQHSQHLYDVKLEGLNRLFACAGDFSVTYDGVLRDPSAEWVELLVKQHANQYFNMSAVELIKQKIIKIPDVYHVEMNFQSLLPANFNNYVFSYVKNFNNLDEYSSKVYDRAEIAKKLGTGAGKFVNRVATAWKSGIDAAKQ